MVIYVGSASDSQHDQVLEDVIVSSVKKGLQMFEMSVAPPDATKIPSQDDLLGVTLLMITALYRRQEFFRCSYFVYNNYKELVPEDSALCLEKVHRSILSEKPRMRINEISWDSTTSADHNLSQFINRYPQARDGRRTRRISKQGKLAGSAPTPD